MMEDGRKNAIVIGASAGGVEALRMGARLERLLREGSPSAEGAA